MQALAQTADPQAVAAVKLVSWVTAGAISPSENDFNMWTDAEEAAPGKAPSTGCAQHWSEVEALLASSEIRIFLSEAREGARRRVRSRAQPYSPAGSCFACRRSRPARVKSWGQQP
jgi:hypothetical protein